MSDANDKRDAVDRLRDHLTRYGSDGTLVTLPFETAVSLLDEIEDAPHWRPISARSPGAPHVLGLDLDTLVLVRKGQEMDLTMLCRGHVWHGPHMSDAKVGIGWLAEDGRLLPISTWEEWMEIPP